MITKSVFNSEKELDTSIISNNNIEVRTIYEHVVSSIKEKNWHSPTPPQHKNPPPPYYIHMGPLSLSVPEAFLLKTVELLAENGYKGTYRFTMHARGPFWAFIWEGPQVKCQP